ncbi:hypothetical protein WNY97_17070 [Pseudoalteromonas fuliginea]|uniref:hypothetical protein n=1 Tax=Pseudoalteromonas TaxID=53246 RepID=UPI000517DB4A|nr:MULTISPECIES: hypothetical protein [unclassified Pseudoalteromonas]ALQ10102.1 hypothetical protein D172_018640 [Pseudoalteromonas sp. Bsw20308]
MKKQRPTIPISEWKLATHLEATREIQNQKGLPAHDCNCEWCFIWKCGFTELLPKDLREQLTRIGIEIRHPTDLYKFGDTDNGSSIRVVFHAIGKILSGPNQWTANEMGETLMYHTVRKEPFLSLVVFPQCKSFDEAPTLKNTAAGDLVRIDIRLEIPTEVVDIYA